MLKGTQRQVDCHCEIHVTATKQIGQWSLHFSYVTPEKNEPQNLQVFQKLWKLINHLKFCSTIVECFWSRGNDPGEPAGRKISAFLLLTNRKFCVSCISHRRAK